MVTANLSPVIVHLSPLAVVGGCEVNCLRMIEGLPEHRHVVVVFDTPGDMSERWTAAGAEVYHLDAWQWGARRFRAVLENWVLAQTQPAGVFCWSTSRLPFVLDALRQWRVECAIHLGNPAGRDLTSRVRRMVQEIAFRTPSNIRLVACSSHVAATYFSAAYFRRFPIETVYNPVGPIFDQPKIHRPLAVGSAPRLGMVARLDTIKDQLTLVRALAAMSPAREDVLLEFAGAGEQRDFLQSEAERMGVATRVRFLGSVSDVPELLRNWDIYVHSTTEAEGMGTALAEAMTSGLPCIVSDLKVMREVCGEAAVFVAAGDATAWGRALLAVIQDCERRRILGEDARSRARRMFALPRVAASYLRAVSLQ